MYQTTSQAVTKKQTGATNNLQAKNLTTVIISILIYFYFEITKCNIKSSLRLKPTIILT